MVSVNNNINTLYIDGKPVRRASLGGKVFYEKHNYHLGLVASPSSILIGDTSVVTATLTDYNDSVEGENVKFYQVFEADGHLSFTGQTFTVSSSTDGFSGSGIIIDWGDGTTTTYTNRNSLNHTYATEGDYAISLMGDITSFRVNCFRDCLGLTNVIIPDTVTSLEEDCFMNCSDLTNIIIPDSVTSLGKDCFFGCSSLTNVVIPDSVTNIGNSCFYNCSGLTSVILPNNLTRLSDSCFYNCSGLTNVVIPDSVTSLGQYCLFGCSGLTNVVIPDSVTSLGYCCLTYCSKLTSVILNWETNIPTYNSNWFIASTIPQFSIPNGTLQEYIAAGYPSNKLVERED